MPTDKQQNFPANATTKERLPLFDLLRGSALVSMLIYHFIYDINTVYGLQPDWTNLPLVIIWQKLSLALFIMLSGVSFTLGGGRWRQGVKLLACGLAITLLTACVMPQQLIAFGVLSFFGTALLITLFLRPYLSRLPAALGICFCLALYALTSTLADGKACLGYKVLWLWPPWLYRNEFLLFGFHGNNFFSADYVPLLPHIFCYWLGYYLSSLQKNYWPQLAHYGAGCDKLRLLGRHSLLIYLLHQPLLLALTQVVLWLFC